MKLKELGKNTSGVEVSQITPHGVWLLIQGTEYFLSYEQHPWFKKATVGQIHHVQLLYGFHLRWPDLDVDLELDALINPEKYPLIYK